MTDPLRFQLGVDCPVEHAFPIWTDRINLWWPADHTVSGRSDTEVVLEPRLGQTGQEGTVEAFGRSPDNPVGRWYGLRKGYRGRFGMYLPPLLEALGKAELTHEARNNKVRALT